MEKAKSFRHFRVQEEGLRIKDDVLDATLTPKIIQPTTFAELSGMRTDRVRRLSLIFKQSSIPYQIVKDLSLIHI